MSNFRLKEMVDATKVVCNSYDPGGWADESEFKRWADYLLRVADQETFSAEAMARAAKAIHGIDDADWKRFNARQRDNLMAEVRVIVAALRGKENQYE